jgi:hypothetical protein
MGVLTNRASGSGPDNVEDVNADFTIKKRKKLLGYEK